MAIGVGALIFFGILLTLIFVSLLCIGNSSSIVDAVSKRLGFGTNEPEKELSRSRHVDSGLKSAEKHSYGKDHLQMEEGITDGRYTDAPKTTTAVNGGNDDMDDESDDNQSYDYPSSKPKEVTKEENEPSKIDEEPNKSETETNSESGEVRKIDDLPAYENARKRPTPVPRSKPEIPVKDNVGGGKEQVYQNVIAGK